VTLSPLSGTPAGGKKVNISHKTVMELSGAGFTKGAGNQEVALDGGRIPELAPAPRVTGLGRVNCLTGSISSPIVWVSGRAPKSGTPGFPGLGGQAAALGWEEPSAGDTNPTAVPGRGECSGESSAPQAMESGTVGFPAEQVSPLIVWDSGGVPKLGTPGSSGAGGQAVAPRWEGHPGEATDQRTVPGSREPQRRS